MIIVLTAHQSAIGAPVDIGNAQSAVRGWLKSDRAPLQSAIGQSIKRAEIYSDALGNTLYYVVGMEPEGFVIVSADDLIEPIVGFSPSGQYDPSPENPLAALVNSDLPGRLAYVRHSGQPATQSFKSAAQAKWEQLKTLDKTPQIGTMALTSVSDVRVSPLVQSKWSQSNVSGTACYNYYTPPYAAGSSSNYVCGCVATAMAQLMRFHQWPTSGVGASSFTIYVDGIATAGSLRGGNGSGGAYFWNNMVLDPASGVTTTQRQAIGSLTHDAGVSVSMYYAAGGSSAFTSDAKTAFLSTFDYSNAIYGNVLTINPAEESLQSFPIGRWGYGDDSQALGC